MKYLVPLIIAAATLAAAAVGAATPADAAGDAVAAVYPPWWDRQQAAAAAAGADALILREGVLGSILVVRSDRPDLAGRLRDGGALLVVGAAGLSGC